MAIIKTLGGDRLGSGNKMKTALHNFERSTHDIGNVWRSTMTPGTLVPFYKKICHDGDTISMNLDEIVRTVPAIGPLLGSYKLQLDVFEVPIRLYNGILHNNMVKIGMDMQQVKMPKMTLTHVWKDGEKKDAQVSTSSLMHYLGLKGLYRVEGNEGDVTIKRQINNIVPVLAYYDIFKNYYANKQEENAYVITQQEVIKGTSNILNFKYYGVGGLPITKIDNEIQKSTAVNNTVFKIYPNTNTYTDTYGWNVPTKNISSMVFEAETIINSGLGSWAVKVMTNDGAKNFSFMANGEGIDEEDNNYKISFDIDFDTLSTTLSGLGWSESEITNCIIAEITFMAAMKKENAIKLQKFPLDNIDKMRVNLLRNTALNQTIDITEEEYSMLPYSANFTEDANGNSMCANKMAGLVVKTYQSDIFNNWLSSKWIDGINGINEISAVAVEEGKVKIDAISLGHKVYNMLNRIAVSGGTYEDWREAVYGENALRHAESPIYCGGAAAEIVFEEVVSTADTDTATAGDQPLGSLAGKGTLIGNRGGHIEIHVKEPSYVIGIVSITPRLDYKDGNDFDLTEIDSMNDIHKPSLDQIGFQDLMIERAAWWGKTLDVSGDDPVEVNYAGGKLPAWIEYMTSVNEVHGDFANEELGWMVLCRDYERGSGSDNNAEPAQGDGALKTVPVADWTTYINPTKYNYQFANTKLDAQNFWVQIRIDAKVRRKISAKLIPNL